MKKKAAKILTLILVMLLAAGCGAKTDGQTQPDGTENKNETVQQTLEETMTETVTETVLQTEERTPAREVAGDVFFDTKLGEEYVRIGITLSGSSVFEAFEMENPDYFSFAVYCSEGIPSAFASVGDRESLSNYYESYMASNRVGVPDTQKSCDFATYRTVRISTEDGYEEDGILMHINDSQIWIFMRTDSMNLTAEELIKEMDAVAY